MKFYMEDLDNMVRILNKVVEIYGKRGVAEDEIGDTIDKILYKVVKKLDREIED